MNETEYFPYYISYYILETTVTYFHTVQIQNQIKTNTICIALINTNWCYCDHIWQAAQIVLDAGSIEAMITVKYVYIPHCKPWRVTLFCHSGRYAPLLCKRMGLYFCLHEIRMWASGMVGNSDWGLLQIFVNGVMMKCSITLIISQCRATLSLLYRVFILQNKPASIIVKHHSS